MQIAELQELGLSEGQMSVYLSLLELGTSALNGIQEKTGIDRRNIYDILNKLIERGFVSYMFEKRVRTYQCTHPNKLRHEVELKEQRLKELKGKIPQIQEVFDSVRPEIRAEILRGSEAIKAFLESTFDNGDTYWIGGNSGIERVSTMKQWFKHWMVRRAKLGYIMHDLVDAGTHLEDLEPDNILAHKKLCYKYATLPKEFSSPMVIIISGNRVAQVLWNEQPFCCVFEGEQVRESFMKYFNYFWTDPW